ncbi:MAG: histidine--tRNA ligase [Phycisphaerales bacterium]|nr:histidine--tRNA ligase [Phycisphaerales bacterium]
MADKAHLLQAPKGMRDFYPADMAVRRHIESAWRRVATRHGFEEIEGPTFEHLDLYTRKSGEAIVSEIFRIQHRGDAELALRPEFTPTLARMIAARAATLPQPIKWFAIPLHYRAERPQRGRLREHIQWNVDFVGRPGASDDDRRGLAVADAEVIGCMIDLLRELGLTEQIVRIKISHREVAASLLRSVGVTDDRLGDAFALLDRRDKIGPDEFAKQATALGLDSAQVVRLDGVAQIRVGADQPWDAFREAIGVDDETIVELRALRDQLDRAGLLAWCEWDMGIVRGLAYYTGIVFEAYEVTGAERAIAGGGRYDGLIELFNGPSMPACGFGMGDVVLSLVLQEHDLLPDADQLMPRPDVFVVPSGKDDADQRVISLVASLRSAGLHARRTYRTTRNIGKLLKEAAACRARYAAIVEGDGSVTLKNLATGEQETVKETDLPTAMASRAGRRPDAGES